MLVILRKNVLKEITMTEHEWKHYVDTGEVPMHFFKSMVEAIKTGVKLNSQHLAVYQSHGRIIEVLLSIK